MFQKKTESEYRVTAKKTDPSLSPSDSLTPALYQKTIARQLSLYWEGDLRNLSIFFLIKEKNLSLKLKSWWPSKFGEKESAPNNRIIDKLTVLKTENLRCLYLGRGYFAQPENFTTFFVYFFVIFWYQSWIEQTSESGISYFFSMKDIVQWSKKITTQSHAILEPTQKVSAF